MYYMPKMDQIHVFAVKWCDKFRDQTIHYIELVDHYMADDCEALGFVMDCGNAFAKRYGDAVSNVTALDKIIDEVKDISLLGSAIYSRWRYFNHWAYSAEEILEPQNRTWFILALGRLAILTGENPFIFSGQPKQLRIVSNNIGFGPPTGARERGGAAHDHHFGRLCLLLRLQFRSTAGSIQENKNSDISDRTSCGAEDLGSCCRLFQ